MTDDEAFIRAIVTGPGDDAPRLVYADRLDEREDPRGEVLRREVEFFQRPGQGLAVEWVLEPFSNSMLHSMPIWSARVCRPPVGVCCDRMTIEEQDPDLPRPTLTLEAIAAVERRFGITLPPDYRAFLLNYNGGKPQPATFQLPDGRWTSLYHFHTIWTMDGTAPYDEDDLVARLELKSEDVFWNDPRLQGFVDIGRAEIGDREWLCLDCGSQANGAVFLIDLWMDTPEPVVKLAGSFAQFLTLFAEPIENAAA